MGFEPVTHELLVLSIFQCILVWVSSFWMSEKHLIFPTVRRWHSARAHLWPKEVKLRNVNIELSPGWWWWWWCEGHSLKSLGDLHTTSCLPCRGFLQVPHLLWPTLRRRTFTFNIHMCLCLWILHFQVSLNVLFLRCLKSDKWVSLDSLAPLIWPKNFCSMSFIWKG